MLLKAGSVWRLGFPGVRDRSVSGNLQIIKRKGTWSPRVWQKVLCIVLGDRKEAQEVLFISLRSREHRRSHTDKRGMQKAEEWASKNLNSTVTQRGGDFVSSNVSFMNSTWAGSCWSISREICWSCLNLEASGCPRFSYVVPLPWTKALCSAPRCGGREKTLWTFEQQGATSHPGRTWGYRVADASLFSSSPRPGLPDGHWRTASG